MDAHLKLKSKISVIGSISDFTFKWSMNAGLGHDDAIRLSLAVTELVTDIVLFAFPNDTEGSFEITYHKSISSVEVVINEFGEPFEPENHLYNSKLALETGNFEGAGLELAKKLVDNFLFLSKGKAGKEFRISQNISSEHIADMITSDDLVKPQEITKNHNYKYFQVTPKDAEDIAKLTYRSYGYTYVKDELYFPKRIELAIQRKEKFGIISRSTKTNEPVGYFAILKTTDSKIGEVGEVVVAIKHRKRGIMEKMMSELIGIANKQKLHGLFGEAVTVHTISQKVNHKFGFSTTALLLSAFPTINYKGLIGKYPQEITVAIDFLVLNSMRKRKLFLPKQYEKILKEIYKLIGLKTTNSVSKKLTFDLKTKIDLKVSHDFKHSLITVQSFGKNFIEIISETLNSLSKENLNVIFIDLPLSSPQTQHFVKKLNNLGFIFSGLMPMFHNENDYLRLQKIFNKTNFKYILAYSEIAKKIKKKIAKEYNELHKK